MFKIFPNIYAHISALKNGCFVLEDKILIKNNDSVDVKSRECPHRGYLMHNPGDVVNHVVCKLHGFAWDKEGRPLEKTPYCSHFYKLHHHGSVETGNTGLIFQNFKEPKNKKWVSLLSNIGDLSYAYSFTGSSNGSWLWLMEQMTDLLHIRQNGIHPRQSLETPLDMINTDFGDGWAIQTYTNSQGEEGFWLFIYPWFEVEYEPGKLTIGRITPNDLNNEYGFKWQMQFYYASNIGAIEKEEWEKCIEVLKEDISAIENIKRPFYPLKRTVNKWEDQMKHWGEWYMANKISS